MNKTACKPSIQLFYKTPIKAHIKGSNQLVCFSDFLFLQTIASQKPKGSI
jgi:hypothetical protein